MNFSPLSPKHVIAIHDEIVSQTGGHIHVRSKELLESAVFRMQSTFDGKELYPTIHEKAAVLFESLCKNHPFVDGNKRTAFVAAATLLEINGHETHFDQKSAEQFVLKVATTKVPIRDIVAFFKKHSKKRG